MSCQFRRLPTQPNHIPTPTMIGGTAVTTALATRSTKGIVTGRTCPAGAVAGVDPMSLLVCEVVGVRGGFLARHLHLPAS